MTFQNTRTPNNRVSFIFSLCICSKNLFSIYTNLIKLVIVSSMDVQEQVMKIVANHPFTWPIAADQPPGSAVDLSRILPGYPSQETEEFRSDIFIAPPRLPLSPIRRLVVLMPEGSMDENALAQKIWRLASISSVQVVFLGLSPDHECAPSIRRRLALLAAAMNQGALRARGNVYVVQNWKSAVQKVLRSGDLLVCLDNHTIPYLVIGRKKLGESMASTFGVPVYMLAGFPVGHSPTFVHRLQMVGVWSLSIAIMVGFTGLQIWLSKYIDSRLSPILLGLSIIAEGITLLITIECIG
jgi:hypothetical protein